MNQTEFGTLNPTNTKTQNTKKQSQGRLIFNNLNKLLENNQHVTLKYFTPSVVTSKEQKKLSEITQKKRSDKTFDDRKARQNFNIQKQFFQDSSINLSSQDFINLKEIAESFPTNQEIKELEFFRKNVTSKIRDFEIRGIFDTAYDISQNKSTVQINDVINQFLKSHQVPMGEENTINSIITSVQDFLSKPQMLDLKILNQVMPHKITLDQKLQLNLGVGSKYLKTLPSNYLDVLKLYCQKGTKPEQFYTGISGNVKLIKEYLSDPNMKRTSENAEIIKDFSYVRGMLEFLDGCKTGFLIKTDPDTFKKSADVTMIKQPKSKDDDVNECFESNTPIDATLVTYMTEFGNIRQDLSTKFLKVSNSYNAALRASKTHEDTVRITIETLYELTQIIGEVLHIQPEMRVKEFGNIAKDIKLTPGMLAMLRFKQKPSDKKSFDEVMKEKIDSDKTAGVLNEDIYIGLGKTIMEKTTHKSMKLAFGLGVASEMLKKVDEVISRFPKRNKIVINFIDNTA